MTGYDTSYRTYKTVGHATRVLSTWSQRRCEKCKVFLGKHGQRFCKKHQNIPVIEAGRKYRSKKKVLP